MATAHRARLTRHDGMTFAFTLAAAFSVVSVVFAWRRRAVAAEVAFALGAALLLAGMLVPTYLGPVKRVWMGLGHLISKVTGPVVLALVYYVALTPAGYLRRTFGRSPLARDRSATSYWMPRAPRNADERRRALERQF
jgi:Saxitoxin biosynthesis operon protein SxtJ